MSTRYNTLNINSAIVKALVALAQALMIFPKRLLVNVEGGTIFLTCTREDMGRLVGEGGNTVHAFRKLANEAGVRFILNEPDRLPDAHPVKDTPLGELVLTYHQSVADRAEVFFRDEKLIVSGSLTRPSTQMALTAIVFKIAKHSGQEGALEYV